MCGACDQHSERFWEAPFHLGLRLSPARFDVLVSHCFPKGNHPRSGEWPRHGEQPQRIYRISVLNSQQECS